MTPKDLIDRLRSALPPTFTRKYICERLGGYLTPGTLANLDSQEKSKGPGGIRAGKTVLYERERFLAWLERRLAGGATDE